MPCLIELGSASKEVHYRIGEKIGQICDLAIITTEDRLKEIREGAINEGMELENIIFLENPKEIEKMVAGFRGENDIVLLEGRANKEIIRTLIKM
jgi:UDP-N-acetylmuramyl pentapeptide synthase